MYHCECKTKVFFCGMFLGLAVGAITVGISKKAQSAIKKGKQMITEKLSKQNNKDEENEE